MNTSTTDTAKRRVSHRKRRLFALLAITLVLVTAFTATELYYRVAREPIDLWALTGRSVASSPNPMRSWADVDAFCAYRPRPGQYDNQEKKTVNSEGFISTPEIAVAKPPGTTRVVFLGGSSTAGTGWNLRDKHTWPWRVAETLRIHFDTDKIEFINAAVGGYSTFESYGRFWSRLRFYDPDVVVVYHGWNEMYYFGRPTTTWRTLPDGSWTLDRTAQPAQVYEPSWVDHLVRPSQVLSDLRIRLSASTGEVGTGKATPLADSFERRGLETFRQNLRLLRTTADALGVEMFVCKQATLIVPDLPDEQRERCAYHFHGFDHDAHLDAFASIYGVIDEEVPSDRIIDVTPLSGEPDSFYDHIHPTPNGTTRIAEVVSAALINHLESNGTGPVHDEVVTRHGPADGHQDSPNTN